MVTLRQTLEQIPALKEGRVVSGEESLDREIGWPQIVDIPGVADWLHDGDLLLTTAFVLREPTSELRALLHALNDRGVVGAFVAVGRYLPHIPPPMRDLAERLHFPLVELPWQVPLAEIARQISRRIISEHRDLLTQSLDIHRTLTRAAAEGVGLQTVAALLAQLLECGVTIEDTDLRVLASAPGPITDPARESSLAHGHTPAAIKEHLRQRGFLDALAREPRATRVGPFPELGIHATRIVAPIVAAREVLGYVWALVGHRTITHLDYLGVEHAATVAALILTRERAVREARAHHRRDLLDLLLSGEVVSPEHWGNLIARAERAGLDTDKHHRVFLARGDTASPSALERVESRWMALVEERGSGLVGRREGHVVLVADESLASVVLAQATSLVDEAQAVLIGVGESVSIAGLARSYAQALEATEIYRRLGRTTGVADFHSLGVLHWLYHMPAELREENPYLEPLRRARREHPVLVETLEVYLDTGANAVQAARTLYLHRSTLLYRLRRLEEILDLSLTDPLVRLNLHVALKALRLERSGNK